MGKWLAGFALSVAVAGIAILVVQSFPEEVTEVKLRPEVSVPSGATHAVLALENFHC